MAGIRQYEVTVPPTSDEVAEFIWRAIRNRDLLPLQAKPEPTDIGPQEEDEVALELKIKSTLHPEEGGMRILGETATGDTVNLVLAPDPEEPARLSMVFEH